jgi:hypothetical protein
MIHYPSNPSAALGSAIGQNAQEQRSFDYFRARTAPALLSCFDSELWSLYVLQLTQNEPGVRGSDIAMGCLHEQFENSSIGRADSQYALKQYTKAIHHVIGSLEPRTNHSTDIDLLLCALFASFESLLGHYSSAFSHITSGMKVLRKRPSKGISARGTYIPARLSDSLFSRLRIQVLQIA